MEKKENKKKTAQAAQQAVTTGNRRDIAQYLRLRRQAAGSH